MDVASEREREREKKEEEEEAGTQHRVDWGPVCSMQLTRRIYTTCICSTPTLHAWEVQFPSIHGNYGNLTTSISRFLSLFPSKYSFPTKKHCLVSRKMITSLVTSSHNYKTVPDIINSTCFISLFMECT
jgi:hypothetical protein